ncbi:HNH endonuclease [Paenibacillus amylolyticus]|uniref:HNH endonuclease n=1 Tax=Paenibacillus amylolyticus TaxID=1451 RepID=UPI003EBD7118
MKHDKPRHVCIAESGGLRLIFGAEPGNVRVPEPDVELVAVVVKLGVRERHNGDMRVAQATEGTTLEYRHDGGDRNSHKDKPPSPVKSEREQNVHVSSQSQRPAGGNEQGRDSGRHVDPHVLASSALSEAGAVSSDQAEKDVAISSVSASASPKKKRRRRRKRKPSEILNAHASAEAGSEGNSSTDLNTVDGAPGGEHPPGEVHSPGVAAAPAPVAADQPPAARRKRKRRRKRAAALAPGAGQARSGAAEAPAPEPSQARGEASAGLAHAAAKAQPAAAGREPSHASRSHGAGMDGRPRRHHAPPAAIDPEDPASLRTNRQGMVRMRGKTDKGRRWHQEVDMELAVTLVKEKAAVVVNRYTIRRLFSNKDFKRFILDRDKYTCYFCGSYGDTIDHLLPRAKGGHTTPLNCVCACNLCNQSKAAMDAEEFIRSGIPEWNAAHQAELLELELQENGLE